MEEPHEKKIQEINAQVRQIHQSDRSKVQQQGRHLFDLSVPKRLEQTLDGRKKWIECANTAYEVWAALQATKNIANQPFEPLWNKNHGCCLHV